MSKQLTKGALTLLQDAIDTGTILGIERMVIDSHSLRGESQDNGTMMLLPFPAGTELEFGAMGISRISVLKARLRLLANEGTITPEFKVRDSGDQFVFRLALKKGKTTIDFKCADPAQIKAPKGFNDPDYFGFAFSADDIKLMLSAKSAMQADTVTFASKDGKTVAFSISASEGDALTHTLECELDSKTTTETFAASYKTKILFPVLKEIMDAAKEADVDVVLTRRGIMKIEVNMIPVYVFPEV
jgi:hypothetical protein